MASEIRVNKIENRSGLGTVTFADTGVDLAGIVTATTFSGSGASLTALPAAQVTGTLPAISGANLTALNGSNIASGTVADARISTLTASKLSGALPAISAANLTNVPAANVVGVHTSLTVTNATTTGTAVVGGGVTISESGIEASGIGITCANINGTQIGGRRNIIINGAMMVAQRGTSSTSSGYQTVDRFSTSVGGTDEAPTQAQVDLSSSDTPYSLGFRKAIKLTNGNQTSGGGAGDYLSIVSKLEAQDIANSGWNYTDSSSNITMSFWAKSSVAKTFILSLYTQDGTDYAYNHKYALAANTWTKITHTFPGNSNLTFDNDNGLGIQFQWIMYFGTTYTSGSTVDQWVTYGGYTSTPDDTNDWYVQNDATFELTGVQLEVGSQATAFEHRSFGDELRRCQRYCFRLGGGDTEQYTTLAMGIQSHSDTCKAHIQFPVTMRSKDITFTFSDLTLDDDVSGYTSGRINSVNSDQSSTTSATLIFDTDSMGTVNPTRVVADSVGGYIQGEAEL